MSTENDIPPPERKLVKGAHGVHLKRFEQVVLSLIEAEVTPSYQKLPPSVYKVPVLDHKVGVSQKRHRSKSQQVDSVVRCIVALLPPHIPVISDAKLCEREANTTTCYTIVDFGGGSGHLSIPLALMLPTCRIICVDINHRSLALLHRKVSELHGDHSSEVIPWASYTHFTKHENKLQQCEDLPNLFTFHGSLQALQEDFDMAVAVHLCGEHTDVVLRMAGQRKAQAIVVVPCCVGKLSSTNHNPHVYLATGTNESKVQYPQSSVFCQFIRDDGDWDSLVQAADFNTKPEEIRSKRNASKRTAKAYLETDRRLFLKEVFGYTTALARMEPWEATPKNDILLAWRTQDEHVPRYDLTAIDDSCAGDIKATGQFLLESPQDCGSTEVDWSKHEESEIRSLLEDYIASDGFESYSTLTFPSRMGKSKRKLVHYLAEELGLNHWSHGSKHGEKTVCIARKRQ